MRRDLARLANDTFDILVIGGGITGACIARDAAMRGLSVAMVEKNDFAHATSAHNSKLIHGGLRYLRNFELGLVRESLRERRIWQRIAPHLVEPLRFLLPLYNANFRARATLRAGLALYDVLSYDRGWLTDPFQRLPGHAWLDAPGALAREPRLDGAGFNGAFVYSDAQMYAPERLALECVIDADAHGAAVANHLAADQLLFRSGRVEGAKMRDSFSDTTFDIRARLTIVAAGPWADIFLAHALSKPVSHKLLRSKGIHLIVPSLTRGDALTLQAGRGHFFVLPWREHSILGTTDTAFQGAPDTVGVSEGDIASLLALVNKHLPAANLGRADVRHFYAGLRPLVDDGSGDSYGASRRAELVDHARDNGIEGLFSVLGGKWTTSRHLAESSVDAVVAKLGATTRPCSTSRKRLPGGSIDRVADFLATASETTVSLHLARLYGSRMPKVTALALSDPGLRQSLSASGDIGAQIALAMREEMAMTLEDVVMRRTGIGQLGNPGRENIESAATLMAHELGWSETRKRAEIENIAANFRTTENAL